MPAIARKARAFDVTTEFPHLGLHWAASTGDVGLTTYALQHGQPVNSVIDGVLPLHAACSGGNEGVVQLLVDHGADVNAPRMPRRYSNEKNRAAAPAAPIVGSPGATPLHFAAANGHTHIVRLLLRRGARADVADKHGITPDMLAADRHPDTAALLRAWTDGQERDLRERAEAVGVGTAGPEAERKMSADGTRRIHVKASVERFLRRDNPSSASLVHPAADGDAEYSTCRRPSLPHVPTPFGPPPSAPPPRRSNVGRRPRSAGTGAERPPPTTSASSPYPPSSGRKRLGSKLSLLSLLRRPSDEPPSPGCSPPTMPVPLPGMTPPRHERRLSATLPPTPRAPLPTAVEMHNALTRGRSGSGSASGASSTDLPIRRTHARTGSSGEHARARIDSRLRSSDSAGSLRGIAECAPVPSPDADIEEETEEDTDEDEYGEPLERGDFGPEDSTLSVPAADGRERGGSVSSAVTTATTASGATDSSAPTSVSPALPPTPKHASRVGLGLDLDGAADAALAGISSHAQAEAAVQRAQARVLALATPDVAAAAAPAEEAALSPLSARLAAYGESLALERALQAAETRVLERKGSLERAPGGAARVFKQRGAKARRPHTANAEVGPWGGAPPIARAASDQPRAHRPAPLALDGTRTVDPAPRTARAAPAPLHVLATPRIVETCATPVRARRSLSPSARTPAPADTGGEDSDGSSADLSAPAPPGAGADGAAKSATKLARMGFAPPPAGAATPRSVSSSGASTPARSKLGALRGIVAGLKSRS